MTNLIRPLLVLFLLNVTSLSVAANIDDTDASFAKGMEILKKRSENPPKLVPEALAIFQTVLREHPSDEKSLAAIIYTYTLMGGYGLLPIGEACDRALTFVQTLEQNPIKDAKNHYALGRWKMWCKRDISAAIPDFEKASARPSEFQIESLFSLATIQLFRADELDAKETLKKIRARGVQSHDQFIWFDLYLRHYDAVLESTALLLKEKPTHRNAMAYRARAYLALGRSQATASPDKARQFFKNSEELFKTLSNSAPPPAYNESAEHVIALAFLDRDLAMREYRELVKKSDDFASRGKPSPILSYRLSQIAAALDLKAEAEKHFVSAIDRRESIAFWVGIDPVMKPLRENSTLVKNKMIELGLRSK